MAEQPLVKGRWRSWPLAALFALPFLFVSIPPLTDVPGHIGRFAVQTAPAGDPLFRYFGFHWTLTLNLASDGVVHLLHPLGLIPVVWVLCAATPVLTALGIVAVARVLNPRGSHALPWALLFVYNFPFFWGFLNWSLTTAGALLAFASWVAMATRPRWRAGLFLPVTPLLLIGHGVAGLVAVALIVGHAAGDAKQGLHPRLVRAWPVLLAAALTILVWKLIGASGGGLTVWLPYRKAEAVVMMLRDRNAILDIGSVAASAAVWWSGRRWGARTAPAAVGPLVVVVALFLLTPSLIGGSDRIDTRLAPLIPMLAFAAQDWSAVPRRRRRAVVALGWALLAVRLTVTTISFDGYAKRYARELAALDRVPQGARLLTLTQVDCGWRWHRLEHLANLATLYRGAWVNSHWAIGGVQLLEVRLRPSPGFTADPSQLVWPEHCIDRRLPAAVQDRHTVAEVLPALPLARVDYLWLVDAKLPVGHVEPRLRPVWHDDISALYATAPVRPPTSLSNVARN